MHFNESPRKHTGRTTVIISNWIWGINPTAAQGGISTVSMELQALFGSKPPFLVGARGFRNEAMVLEELGLRRAFGWAIGHTSAVPGIQVSKSEGVRRLPCSPLGGWSAAVGVSRGAGEMRFEASLGQVWNWRHRLAGGDGDFWLWLRSRGRYGGAIPLGGLQFL